jgi:endonuclease/exonuclease/phosphatase family metal-dependent hydrolase
MTTRLRLFTKRFFIYSNIAVAFIFLLACLQPYLNPQRWWFLSFLGLGFPFLLLFVLFFAIGWLIILRPRYTVISGVALLLGIKSITVFFAFHKTKTFDYKKDPATIRVVSWNVARFVELKRNSNKGSSIRLKMFDLIRQQNADVLCLQEFHTSIDSSYYNNIKPIQAELGYPYYYFSFDNDGDNHYYSSIIFSRVPIIDTGKIRYPRPTLPDVLLYTDLKFNQDTVRVFTTHLQSLQFGRKDYERIDQIASAKDSLLENSRNILSKLKKGFSYRSIQADIVHRIIEDSPHPVIVCADLNDVPNSYAYFTVRSNMQDAFLKKGFGVGRTFSSLSPTLRIDYIFTDKHFRIKQFSRITKKYSDHYMLVSDLELKK